MNEDIFLKSVLQQFQDYKSLADKTFAQIDEQEFLKKPNAASNGFAILITHMHGNMLSRWTNFLTEDGEKPWRERDKEFREQMHSKEALLALWEEGWSVLFNALTQLKTADIDRTIFIRTRPLTVIEAIHRQLAHYASHVGQIVYLGKIIMNDRWQSLSINKGASEQFNEAMKQPPSNQ